MVGGRFYEFACCFWNVSRRTAPSSVRAAPCQLPRRGSFCTGLWGGGFTGTPQGSSQNLPHRGRGTARRRWMRGGTALYVVGTVGAEVKRSPHMSFRANAVSRGIFPSCRFYLVVVHYPTWWIPPLRLRYGRNDNGGTFLRIRLQFLERFTLPRPSSVRAAPSQLPRRGSFCTVLWGGGFTGTPQGSSQNLPHRGRGTARRRWMRGGTALYVVGTVGAEVKRSPHMSFRANAVSRGIHASSRFYLTLVLSPTWWIPPLRLRCGRNDNDVTFLRIRLQFLECFTPPRPHQSRLRRASFPGGEAFVPGFEGTGLLGMIPSFHVRNGT